MSAVNVAIVREYFESLGYIVSNPCKYEVSGKRKSAEEEIDLIVYNPLVQEQVVPEAVLWDTPHLASISRAVVGIRGWHSARFSPSAIRSTPELAGFASEAALKVASKRLGTQQIARILCLADLPASIELRKNTLSMLKGMGIDGVLLFGPMLKHLVGGVDSRKNYEKSDLLQTLRILKSHSLIQSDQMELFEKKNRRKRVASKAAPETSPSPVPAQ